jgi:hypothetical protein
VKLSELHNDNLVKLSKLHDDNLVKLSKLHDDSLVKLSEFIVLPVPSRLLSAATLWGSIHGHDHGR